MKVAALMLVFVAACHERAAGDEPEIIFPDEWDKIQTTLNKLEGDRRKKKDDNQLPTDLIRKINEGEEFENILLDYLENKNEFLAALRNVSSPSISLGNRFGTDPKIARITKISGTAQKIEPAQTAKTAECKTELEVVSLVKDLLAYTQYMHYPTCTRVKRCSGCCNLPQMSCQPIKSAQRTFKVYQLTNGREFKSKKSLQFKTFVEVTVEEHEKCKCGCKTTAKDCSDSQYFDTNNCTCRCKNVEAQRDCYSQDDRSWDDTTCTCECENITECTTGAYFDPKECKCMRIRF